MSKHDTRSDPSEYNGEYPYVKVTESWTGHQIQIDDTPGHERLFVRHASGTYIEISADGKVAITAVGDQKNYNKAGVTSTVDENADSKTAGHSRSMSGGGVHIEVAGDAGIVVGGSTALVGMGKVNVRQSLPIWALMAI